MATLAVTDKDFEEKVLKSQLPVLVDFWAPWCGPCLLAGPVLEQISDEQKDKLIVVKVNIDENQEISSKLGVMSIPTVILFNKGEELDRKVGFGGKQVYEELVSKVM